MQCVRMFQEALATDAQHRVAITLWYITLDRLSRQFSMKASGCKQVLIAGYAEMMLKGNEVNQSQSQGTHVESQCEGPTRAHNPALWWSSQGLLKSAA